MTDEEFDILIEWIFKGSLSITAPQNAQMLYAATFNQLFGAIENGWGAIESPAFDVVRKLETNINIFSGAKTWKNIWDVQRNIFDEDGFKRSFNNFKKIAKGYMQIYNETWLRTELTTAVTSARQARYWETIWTEREDLPYLMYQTVGDLRVRPDHQVMDGIIKRVDSSFWNDHYPPNGFNCRCVVIQLASGKETKISKFRMDRIERGMPEIFKMNVGKDKYIFNPKHPYLQAEGLPRPKVAELFKIQKKDNFGFTKPGTKLDKK